MVIRRWLSPRLAPALCDDTGNCNALAQQIAVDVASSSLSVVLLIIAVLVQDSWPWRAGEDVLIFR